MNLDNITSLKELEKVLLKELHAKNFDGEEFSVYEAFSRNDNLEIDRLTKKFNENNGFIDNIDNIVLDWYKVNHEVTHDSLPYWIFMDYITTKAVIDHDITLEKYTREYLRERYEYNQATEL